MLYEVINNLDGFKSRLVEALQLPLNIQFLFLTNDGVSVSNSSCCHWYEKAQAKGHLYCPWPPPPPNTRRRHNYLILEVGHWFVMYNDMLTLVVIFAILKNVQLFTFKLLHFLSIYLSIYHISYAIYNSRR